MPEDLASQTCVPCRGGVPPLKGAELQLIQQKVPQWNVVNEHHITRNFTFPDFKQALAFVNRVGEVAEQQGGLVGAPHPRPNAFVGRVLGHVLAEKAHAAGAGRVVAGDDVEQRRLARAVGADHRPALTRGDREREVLDRTQGSEIARHAIEPERIPGREQFARLRFNYRCHQAKGAEDALEER